MSAKFDVPRQSAPSRSGTKRCGSVPVDRCGDAARQLIGAVGPHKIELCLLRARRGVVLLELPIQDPARLMAELEVGVLPVSDGGKLVGMITDRDIAIRAVALGLGPHTQVVEVMTPGARYCHAGDRLDKVLEGMGLLQVRRMPVLDREGRLVGIVSLADASAAMSAATAEALCEISEPGGDHSQGDDR